RRTAIDLPRHPQRHRLRVGLTLGEISISAKIFEKVFEILDYAIVNDGDPARDVRMGIAFARAAMGGPARMPDTDRAVERCLGQPARQIIELALGAPTIEPV